MKVCKKCKNHVPNKAKICRNCGADVSKAKIIKSPNTKNTGSKGNKSINKKITQPKKDTIDVKQKALQTLSEDIKSDKLGGKTSGNLKKQLNKYTEKTNKKISKRKTIIFSNFITNSFNSTRKVIEKVSKKINRKNIAKAASSISKFTKNTWFGTKKILKKGTLVFSKISLPFLKSKESNKTKKNEKEEKFLTKLSKKEQKSKKDNKSKEHNINEEKKNEKEKVKKEKKQRKKIEFTPIKKFLNNIIKSTDRFIKKCGKGFCTGFNKTFKRIGSLFKGIGKGISSLPKKIKRNKKSNYAKIFVILLLIVSALILAIFGGHMYEFLPKKKSEVSTEKATKEKVFSMGDSISYNGAEYKVTKIESSQGNSYKSPKEGNQFLIVTISIKNNSDRKMPYSYENWTMSNSKGEEKKRIFTSINVEDALYSGELVIGGIKKGSMVFEQPIDDPKLKMNFYELKKDENDNEEIDTSKRAFSVSIKAPDEKMAEENNQSQDKDTKIEEPKKQ